MSNEIKASNAPLVGVFINADNAAIKITGGIVGSSGALVADLEANGVGSIVDGFAKAFPDDPNRLRQSGALFDALYALFGEKKPLTKND